VERGESRVIDFLHRSRNGVLYAALERHRQSRAGDLPERFTVGRRAVLDALLQDGNAGGDGEVEISNPHADNWQLGRRMRRADG
jgi:hypothetical protein